MGFWQLRKWPRDPWISLERERAVEAIRVMVRRQVPPDGLQAPTLAFHQGKAGLVGPRARPLVLRLALRSTQLAESWKASHWVPQHLHRLPRESRRQARPLP